MKLTHPERFNIALAQKVLDHVERNPENHQQDTFFQTYPSCGTIGCIAGWAWYLGGEPHFYDEHGRLVESLNSCVWGRPEASRRLLGVTENEFTYFYAEDSEDQAKEILADYIAQAQAVQDLPPASDNPPPVPEPVGPDKELIHA